MADLKISQLTSATLPLAGTEVLPIVQSSSTKKVATNDLTVKNLRSNATTGILQVAGPETGATRVMTTPNANFTAARTDAAQSFTGDQTLSNGNLVVANGNLSVSGTTTLSNLTASTALALDASKNVVSVTNTGSGNNVLATAPTLVGDVSLSTGNLVIGTSGKGIDFSATPGTGTSELFDDYEEGTWSPVYSADTAPTTPFTMSNISATYTKIGRLVTARAFIRTDDVNTAGAAGGVRIINLPFSSAADEWSVMSIGFSAEFAVNNPLYGLVRAGTSEISLFYRALSAGGQTPLALTDLTSGAAAAKNQLVIFAQYYAAT